MSSAHEILASLGLELLLETPGHVRDGATGIITNPDGHRFVGATREFIGALHFVADKERAGVWAAALKSTGASWGKNIATDLDARLARLGKPASSALPLEACLAVIEHTFAVHGWGRLQLDLTDAPEHGILSARLEQSVFVESLPEATVPVDSLLAGVLQGFFEHVSSQTLGCAEIACAVHGAEHCTFVITAPERLDPIRPFIGRESVEQILARLRS